MKCPSLLALFLAVAGCSNAVLPVAEAITRHPDMTEQELRNPAELPQFDSKARGFTTVNSVSYSMDIYPASFDDQALVELTQTLPDVRLTAPYPWFNEDERGRWWVCGTVSGPDGILSGTATSGDPQIVRLGPAFPGGSNPTLTVRIQSSATGQVDLFWGIPAADNFAGARRVSQTYTDTGGGFQELTFDLSGEPTWMNQTITRLRIDPPGATASSFAFDRITTSQGDADGNGLADMEEGSGDADSDGIPDFLDPDNDNDGVLDLDELRSGTDLNDGIYFYGFDEARNNQGWDLIKHGADAFVFGGRYRLTTTGIDPILSGPPIAPFDAAALPNIIVRIKNDQAGNAEIFFDRTDTGGFAAARAVKTPIADSPSWQTLLIEMSANANWIGMIDGLRFDPVNKDNATIQFDFIAGSNGDFDGDGISDATEGTIDLDGDGFGNLADLDSDGDVMDDRFEDTNGLDPTDPGDAGLDADGDGMSNQDEYIAGTGVNDSHSFLEVADVTQTGPTTLAFRFDGIAGRHYDLERKAALTETAPWIPVSQSGVLAADQPVFLFDTSATTNRLSYRITVRLPQ